MEANSPFCHQSDIEEALQRARQYYIRHEMSRDSARLSSEQTPEVMQISAATGFSLEQQWNQCLFPERFQRILNYFGIPFDVSGNMNNPWRCMTFHTENFCLHVAPSHRLYIQSMRHSKWLGHLFFVSELRQTFEEVSSYFSTSTKSAFYS